MFANQFKVARQARNLLRNALMGCQSEDLPSGEITKFLKSDKFEDLAAEALDAITDALPAVAHPLDAAAVVIRVADDVLQKWKAQRDAEAIKVSEVPAEQTGVPAA